LVLRREDSGVLYQLSALEDAENVDQDKDPHSTRVANRLYCQGMHRPSRCLPTTVFTLAIIASSAAAALAADDPYRDLVWHVESLDGTVINSRKADEPINPASIVKLATTLWALEVLGPDHRFETAFVTRGALDPETGVLDGDLFVVGGGDPDFHRENAFLLARALNDLGVKTIRGDLRVDSRFWIGWEGGASHRLNDPAARSRLMASRLRSALDRRRWDRATQRAWRELAARRQLPAATPPRVEVLGEFGPFDGAAEDRALVVHRSKPLAVVLRRFNCYSNNDIERVAELRTSPDKIAGRLVERWGLPPRSVTFETASGLGTNRLTPRQIVRLLRELRTTCVRLGLDVATVLPVTGCDPGTLQMFPRLNEGKFAASLVGKTGTLPYTDDGVSVLAGVARTAQGELLFSVVMPRAGRKLHWARVQEEAWLLDLIAAHGGPKPGSCGEPLPLPDVGAEIVLEPPSPHPVDRSPPRRS
jgi:D-alanyl-D-alanine carboxypeptidase/D-alanyl-D-alanine-endopeptidase (penicillin-binding protein 4)